MDISLTCAGCPQPGSQSPPPWARASGFGACLSWLERDAEPGRVARLLDRPPVIGATYSLLVRHPFYGRMGAPLWVLFEPAAPWRDGWADHADRLPELGMARIEPLGFLGQSNVKGSAEDQTGWLTARVEELVLAPDLAHTFATVRGGALGTALAGPWPEAETTVVRRGSLALYERSLTAEIGMWALVHRSALGSPSLLAVGEWGFHLASVHAGHRPLTPAEAARLPGLT